jgi:hypothetical protein
MTAEKRGSGAREVATALRVVAVTAAAVLLFACGAAASDERASSSSYEVSPESTSALPSKRLLVGTWREARENVLLRFHRDDTFKIGSQLATPFAIGTYALSGSMVRFRPVGPWCVDPWTWGVSVRKAAKRLGDELDVYFVTLACDEPRKTKWRFTRISYSPETTREAVMSQHA